MRQSYYFLHFVVLLWGFTPIIGKAVPLRALDVVWGRLLFAVPALWLWYGVVFRKIPQLILGDWVRLAWGGFLIAIHWLAFYGAIKVSNVATTMAAFSSVAVFSALLEPILFRRKLDSVELVAGLVAMIAVGSIFYDSSEGDQRMGILLSLLAAFLSSAFSVYNGLLVKRLAPATVSTVELTFGFILLSIYGAATGSLQPTTWPMDTASWLMLAALGLVCTAFAFVASNAIMKQLSPYTVSLTVNLESIYGIVLAALLFGDDEHMSLQFYIATLFVFASVFAPVLWKSLRRQTTH